MPPGERQVDLHLSGLGVVDPEAARLGQSLDLPQRMEVVAGVQAVEQHPGQRALAASSRTLGVSPQATRKPSSGSSAISFAYASQSASGVG